MPDKVQKAVLELHRILIGKIIKNYYIENMAIP